MDCTAVRITCAQGNTDNIRVTFFCDGNYYYHKDIAPDQDVLMGVGSQSSALTQDMLLEVQNPSLTATAEYEITIISWDRPAF